MMSQARLKLVMNIAAGGVLASSLMLGGCGSSKASSGYNPPDLYFATTIADQVEGAGDGIVYATLEFEDRPIADVTIGLKYSGSASPTSHYSSYYDGFVIEPSDLNASNQLTFELIKVVDDLEYDDSPRQVRIDMTVVSGPAETTTGGVAIFNIEEDDPAPTTLIAPIGIASLTPSATVPLN